MPAFLRRLRARVKYWNNAAELEKELEVHREMLEQRHAEDAETAEKARRLTGLLFGNVTLAREDAREVWIARWAEQLMQDTRYAMRIMRREWAFALTGSITLALGSGVLIGVFAIFNGIFLKPWPVRDARDVFGVSTALADAPSTGFGGASGRISYLVWDRIRTAMTTANLAVKFHHFSALRIAPDARGRTGRFGLVDDRFIETVGIPVQFGALRHDGGEPGVMISDSVWERDFGRDRAVVGRRIWMDEHEAVVSGVLDPRFVGFPPLVYDGLVLLDRRTVTWLTENLSNAPDLLTSPKACCVEIIGRLRPGRVLADAGAEMSLRVNGAHNELGLPKLTVTPWHTAAINRRDGDNSMRTVFALLFAGCAIVTMLACANLGNLQLARGLRRTRELAVRVSLGANRTRIVRQLVTESAVISALGAIGGLLLSWTLPTVWTEITGPTSQSYAPDAWVVALSVGIAVVATLISGLAPALRVTTIDWRGAGSSVVSAAGKLRGVLLAAQIALSLSLIASAALLSRGALRAADGAEVGFEFRGISAFIIAVTAGSDTSAAQKVARETLRDALHADPNLALADTAPWRRSQPYFQIAIPGRADFLLTQNAGFNHRAIALLQLPLVTGRWPNEDRRLHESVISRSLARALWHSEDVLGKTFLTNSPFSGQSQYSVVGLMDEVRLRDASPMPAVITAPETDSFPVILGDASLESEIKTLVRRADPTLRVLGRPMIANLREGMEKTFVGISVASGLGGIALLLASFGVFGVFAYVVEERKREIGVRLALGATRAQVRRSLVTATRGPIAGGLSAGIVLALIGGFVLRGNLFGISILDPLSYLAVAAILGVAAVTATAVPLRRALRVDPAITLRSE